MHNFYIFNNWINVTKGLTVISEANWYEKTLLPLPVANWINVKHTELKIAYILMLICVHKASLNKAELNQVNAPSQDWLWIAKSVDAISFYGYKLR